MQAGDFFLISEHDLESRLIQLGTHGKFNHCGLITSTAGATVEALGGGVAVGDVHRFRASTEVAIVDSGLTPAERAIAVAFTGAAIGDAYDFWDLASFGVNLMTDGRFVIGQAGRFICSALVYRALQQANFTRFPADCRTISPNDLAKQFAVPR